MHLTKAVIYFIRVLQRTFEFTLNDKKVKEDVSVDVKDNYVQYHMSDGDSEVWVIEDFNRVSLVGVLLISVVHFRPSASFSLNLAK